MLFRVPQNDLPTLSAKKKDRENLEADVAAFLANGGIIKASDYKEIIYELPKGVYYRARDFVSINELPPMLWQTTKSVEALIRRPDFPRRYHWKGEHKWLRTEVKAWMKLNVL